MSIKEVKEALAEMIRERAQEKVKEMDWSDILWTYTLDVDDDIENVIEETAEEFLDMVVDDMKESVIRSAVGDALAENLHEPF